MEPLDIKQLNETCQRIIDNCPRDYPDLAEYFTTLYTFGLRPIEATELERWSFESHDTIVVKTAKGGNSRIIKANDVIPSVKEKVLNKVKLWDLCRYNTMRMYCQRFSPYPFAVCKNKEIGMYIYRHTYIKNLSDMGIKPENIAQIIGEVDVKNIYGYIESKIFPSK